jgi:glycerol-3-phosphate dehydrogenase
MINRSSTFSSLSQPWDILVIGGGITGAGILREAARARLKAVLVEAQDYASGTSSRSSKMVHGGLRYLKNAQIRMTWESVRERQRLLRDGRGLVAPLGFLLANFKGDAIPGWVFGLGLIAYDMLAFDWAHRRYDAYDMHDLCPPLRQEALEGGYRYFDAQTDDARLVLRLILEAQADGAAALNYCTVIELLKDARGQVAGAAVRDDSPEGQGRTAEIRARVVVNATGAWADTLRQEVGGRCRLRKLRGSHLIFPAARLPLTRAVSFLHPADHRPVFAFPWEGVTLLGTTDVDQPGALDSEPRISEEEVDYLMEAVRDCFPRQALQTSDIQATYAGVRPVIDTGCADPSKESREHVLWNEHGLLTVAGGKLTTFRVMAYDALQRAATRLPNRPRWDRKAPVLDGRCVELPLPSELSPAARLRLVGRFGSAAGELLQAAQPGELAPIDATPNLWAELRWAARAEAVEHLDDLLLRRVRLGLLAKHGGLDEMPKVRLIAQPELGWSDARWEQEEAAYRQRWQENYYLPKTGIA